MRKFGKTKEVFFEFQIEGKKKTYKIPIAASMPITTMLYLKEQDAKGKGLEAQIEMLRKYMGDDVDTLPAETITEILKAWAEESKEYGASVGESSASPEQ